MFPHGQGRFQPKKSLRCSCLLCLFIHVNPVSYSLDTKRHRVFLSQLCFIADGTNVCYCGTDSTIPCCFMVFVTQICPSGCLSKCTVETHYSVQYRAAAAQSDWTQDCLHHVGNRLQQNLKKVSSRKIFSHSCNHTHADGISWQSILCT